mgnify:CR=1 FL=1
MSNSYRLINPHIEGDMKTKVKAKNSVEAAKIIYINLSEHFNNNLPKFNFTIQKGSSGKGKYYSFQTKEIRNGEDVKFSIKPVSIKNEKKSYKNMILNINKFKKDINKSGGVIITKEEIDQVNDDSSDYYRRAATYVPVINHPINFFFYDPSLYRLKSLFVPTFYSYITPVINILL